MKRSLIVTFSICVVLVVCAGNTAATTIVLYPVADAYVSSDYPETNFGTETKLVAGKKEGSNYFPYIKFDLSSIPPGQAIFSARLRLYAYGMSTESLSIRPSTVTDDSWQETEINGSTAPGTYYSQDMLFSHVVYGDNFMEVGAEVDRAYITDGLYSVMIGYLVGSSYEYYAYFSSREHPEQFFRPYLEVEYGVAFGGGSGTSDDPYQIFTGEQMNNIGLLPGRWSRNYVLMNNIVLSGPFNPIGRYESTLDYDAFSGTFDGQGHSISGLSVASGGMGLFSCVTGRVKNVELISPDVHGDDNVGSLIGFLYGSVVQNCRVEGGSVWGNDNVGGLVGNNYQGYLTHCYSNTSVSGNSKVGGLFGYSYFSETLYSYALGPVSGVDYVGGFAGRLNYGLTKDCYCCGLVSGGSNVGGFLGGHTQAQEPNGSYFDDVVACFWDVNTSGQSESAGGTRLSTVQMYDVNTYLDAGWDFVGETENGPSNDWAERPGGGYPILGRQLAVPPPLPGFSGGTGEPNNPYLIGSVDELNSIGREARLADKHFRLISDLELDAVKVHTIGSQAVPFSGTFDGNDHCLSNFHMKVNYFTKGAGLFKWAEDAELTNLTLSRPAIEGGFALGVGSLAGSLGNGTVKNCHAKDAVVQGYYDTGGLLGIAQRSKVSGCSATGNVGSNQIAYSYTGGLIGQSVLYAEVSESFADANVASGGYVGGLIGYFGGNATLKDSYALGPVSSESDSAYVGGLLGCNRDGQIISCYASGSVSAPSATCVGALVGANTGSSVSYAGCFFNAQVNPTLPGIYNSSDSNVVGLSEVGMMTAEPFLAGGWDFVDETVNGVNDVWDICEGINYPRLSWQELIAGDIDCSDEVDFVDYAILACEWKLEILEMDTNYDGNIDFTDWADFAQNWDGDYYQLSLLCDSWLERSARYADIAPENGDDIVDWHDLVLLCDNWLGE